MCVNQQNPDETCSSEGSLEFFRRIGQRVVRTASTWWHEAQPRVMLSYPYQQSIEPDEDEIRRLFRDYKLRVLRFPTPLDSYGFPSTVAVNTNNEYNLKDLHVKARNQTRRGLENCKVLQLDFNDLREHGLRLNQDTAQRQGRESQYADPTYWKTLCEAGEATPGLEAWGSFVEGELAAYLVSVRFGSWVCWLLENSANHLLTKRPNNALAFEAGRHYLCHTDIQGICYGLGSLESVEALDRFKRRMGWTLQPIKQRLVISRTARAVCLVARGPLLTQLGRFFPKSYSVRKATAIIQLYQQQSSEVPAVPRDTG